MWKLLLFLFLPLSLEAKSLELKGQTSSIFIEPKEQWVLGKELFGMPFIYFSPYTNGQRSNISFTDSGVELKLNVNSLEKNQKDYQNIKHKWAKDVGAKSISFVPYHKFENKLGHKIHQIGFNYEHEGKSYFEKSYYIECRGKMLFSKSLRLRENEGHETAFNDFINKLDCGGV